MNVANLQLEGMLLAFTAVLRSLVESGALSEAQLKAALAEAERTGLSDRQRGLLVLRLAVSSASRRPL